MIQNGVKGICISEKRKEAVVTRADSRVGAVRNGVIHKVLI